jgi:hypothetical protein
MSEHLNLTIQALEEKLLQPKTRHSMNKLNDLLADDFVEYGASGMIYCKHDVLEHLPSELGDTHVTMLDFELKRLAQHVVQTTYKTLKHKKNIVLRSSIWKKDTHTGCWQICFHQATLQKKEKGITHV